MPSSDIRGGMTFDAFFTGIYLHALPGQVEVEVATRTNAREAAYDGAQARMSAASGASARASEGACASEGDEGPITLKTRLTVAAAWGVMHMCWGAGFLYGLVKFW